MRPFLTLVTAGNMSVDQQVPGRESPGYESFTHTHSASRTVRVNTGSGGFVFLVTVSCCRVLKDSKYTRAEAVQGRGVWVYPGIYFYL